MEFMSNTTSPMAMTQIRVLGGAMARVPAGETAFAHRDKRILMASSTTGRTPPTPHASTTGRSGYYAAMWPYGDGVYVNFLGNEGQAASATRIRRDVRPAGRVKASTTRPTSSG